MVESQNLPDDIRVQLSAFAAIEFDGALENPVGAVLRASLHETPEVRTFLLQNKNTTIGNIISELTELYENANTNDQVSLEIILQLANNPEYAIVETQMLATLNEFFSDKMADDESAVEHAQLSKKVRDDIEKKLEEILFEE